MKLIIFLALFFFGFFEIYADDSNSISIELRNVTGQAKSGTVPDALSGPGYYDEVETGNLKELVELARRMAPVGIHELPPFDPYSGSNIKNVEIKSLLGIKAKVDVSNVIVRGLQEYLFTALALQSENLSVDDAKLLTFKLALQTVTLNGDVIGNVSFYGIEDETITAKLSALVNNIEVNGSIGIATRYFWNIGKDGVPHYEFSGYNFETDILKLQLNFTNIQQLSVRSRAPWRIPRIPNIDPIVDEITAIVGAAVQKELSKILDSVTAEQVDAFLFPYYMLQKRWQ